MDGNGLITKAFLGLQAGCSCSNFALVSFCIQLPEYGAHGLQQMLETCLICSLVMRLVIVNVLASEEHHAYSS